MTVVSPRFKRMVGNVLMCGAVLALTVGTLHAQAAAPPAPAHPSEPAPAKSTLTVHITGFRNAKGKANIDLFRDGKGFPLDAASVVAAKKLEIDPKTLGVTAVFADLPQGVYAVTVIHDDNLTGKMEFDAAGIPLKGFGFSNNPDPTQGPPAPETATFALKQPRDDRNQHSVFPVRPVNR